MPYIPNFNKLSLQEMAYAPTLMRQQHDETIAKNMELSDALKFDYLKQDASTIEPVLQKYSEDIGKVSQDLAKSGFTQDTKGKILGLRSQFTGDDKIRHIKKQYSDAMEGWGEQKKALIQKGASGDLLNKQKASYFGSYKGAFDNEGFKQDFTPGRTSGVYDIAEDAKKAMTNIGKTGSIVGTSGSSVQKITDDPKVGTYYKVFDSTTGQYITTKDQLSATKAYLKAEYDPRNPTSDRGLYAKISEYTPEYINTLVDQVGASMMDGYYQSLPQTRSNIVGLGSDDEKVVPDENPLSTFPRTAGDTDTAKEAKKDKELLDKPLPQEISGVGEFFRKLKASGIGDASTQKLAYDTELKKTQEKANAKKLSVIEKQRIKHPMYFTQKNPDGSPIDPFTAAQKGIQNDLDRDAKTFRVTGINVSDDDFDNKGMADIILNNKISKVYSGKEPIFKKQSEDRGIFSKDEYSTVEDYKSLWPNKTGYQNEMVHVDENGDILLPHPKTSRLLTVNPEAFDDATQDLQSMVLKPLLKQLNTYNTFDNADDGEIQVGKNINLYFDVVPKINKDGSFDPYDTEQREVVMYQKDPVTGRKVLLAKPMDPPTAKDFLVKGIFNGFKSVDLIIKPTK